MSLGWLLRVKGDYPGLLLPLIAGQPTGSLGPPCLWALDGFLSLCQIGNDDLLGNILCEVTTDQVEEEGVRVHHLYQLLIPEPVEEGPRQEQETYQSKAHEEVCEVHELWLSTSVAVLTEPPDRIVGFSYATGRAATHPTRLPVKEPTLRLWLLGGFLAWFAAHYELPSLGISYAFRRLSWQI